MDHSELTSIGRTTHYEIDEHITDPAAHHARYTDAEALAAVLTGLPETILDTTLTVTLDIGETVFWLGTEHYYERGHNAIVSVLVNSVDKTADPTVWNEGEQRMTFTQSSPAGIACLSNKEPYVNRTIEDNVWWIRRLVATAIETWTVTVRERKILLNPLHITGVRCYPAPPALDTIDFRHSGGHSDAGTTLSNITHYLISGCPAGYEIEIWRWKTRSRYKNRPRRGRRWRPYLRCAPDANGNYILPVQLNHGILGICLYNPTTAARSAIRMFGSNSNYGGLMKRRLRVFA